MVGGGAAAAFSESSILLRKLLQEMRQKERRRGRNRGVKRSFICVFREIDGDAAPISQAEITVSYPGRGACQNINVVVL